MSDAIERNDLASDQGMVQPPMLKPPNGASVFSNVRTHCVLTIPALADQTVTIAQNQDPLDPLLRIGGKSSLPITLNSDGIGKFLVEYRYGLTGPRPDKSVAMVVLDSSGTAIPNTEYSYTFIIRDPRLVIESAHEFGIESGAIDGLLDVKLSVVDGIGNLADGAVRISTSNGNVHFYKADGVTEITEENLDEGFPVLYADYQTGGGALKVTGKIGADNAGIIGHTVTVPGSNVDSDLKLVFAYSAIVPGSLPRLSTTFGETLDLAGPATTYVRLRSIPEGVDPYATVAILVNGNPVISASLTVKQLVNLGCELPKLPFTWPGIDGQMHDETAFLSYLVESDNSDIDDIQGRLVTFPINTTGGVANDPDPSIADNKRTAPMPLLRGTTVVNNERIASNRLEVTIDFSGTTIPEEMDGYLTLYVNGYASSDDTKFTKQETITTSFTTGPDAMPHVKFDRATGIVTVSVDATALRGFVNGAAGRRSSNLKMDYYLVPPGAIAATLDSAEADGKNLDADAINLPSRIYSKFLASGWVISTPNS